MDFLFQNQNKYVSTVARPDVSLKKVTHGIRQTFSFQSLLLQGLLQRQYLSLVLFDCQFYCLARLRAALVCTQPVNSTVTSLTTAYICIYICL